MQKPGIMGVCFFIFKQLSLQQKIYMTLAEKFTDEIMSSSLINVTFTSAESAAFEYKDWKFSFPDPRSSGWGERLKAKFAATGITHQKLVALLVMQQILTKKSTAWNKKDNISCSVASIVILFITGHLESDSFSGLQYKVLLRFICSLVDW